MSEYRLFKVIRTDEQKYFDIEYVRDVVTCGECKWYNCGACFRDDGANNERRVDDFCSYGCREEA